ncbi:glycosyl transferase family 51 [Thalassotalea litorea]|uniref:Glycosyl transferase family 51 n=1 Tax=Thalassotalea litorea TaxID=2020715 RepID=A0A5R9IW70_9GAMM|nr:biosynthetic peptidoglycan transglycosylase [Thalassotalea litorea]TLU66168.1 glycosyl transferase family 51 [Thalassotalea litorea]
MKIIKQLFIMTIFLVLMLSAYEGAMVLKAYMNTQDVKKHWLNEQVITIKFDDVPAERINMLLSVEDPSFFDHNGVDLNTPGAGLTTISQALCKKLYFEKFIPGFAKIEQSLIAVFVLDKFFSKEEQLNLFLNTAYLGHVNGKAIYGFEQAANVYFNTTFAQLSDEQYLALVAMVVAPNGFNIKTKPELNEERVKRIQKLLSGEYVPQEVSDIYYQQAI